MKQPLILIAGHMCDAGLWKHQIEHLGDIADMTVTKIPDQSSVADMARVILATAPPRFAMAGLSLGGYIAFEVMRQEPERVTHLALLDTSARADTPEQTERRHRFIGMAKAGDLDGVMVAYLPLFVHPDRLNDQAFLKELKSMSDRVGETAFFRQQEAMLSRPDSRPNLGRIACPTLVLCGRQDALTPLELHVEIVQLIPGAKLVVVENSGHLSTMEQPEAVTAVLRYWLQERPMG
jgi:pimeloyl-ACP methyl ester carboxylesterase